MASEDMGLVEAQQRLDNGLNHHPPQPVFKDTTTTTTFSSGPPPAQRRSSSSAAVGDHSSKSSTRELTGGFIDHHHHHHHHYFNQPHPTDFRRAMFSSAAATSDRPHQDNSQNWNLSSHASATPSGGDGSEDEDDDVEDDDNDDDRDENEVEGSICRGLNAAGQKDALVVENECGFSGRKEGVYLSESAESLREILSPIGCSE